MRSILLILTLQAFTMNSPAQPRIQYTLAMPRPRTHTFEVQMRIDGLGTADSTLNLHLPVWRPGRYLVLDFAGGVVRFAAYDGKETPLAWKKTDKATWQIQTDGARTVVARYDVYANEFDLRTRGLNDEHGFVSGTSLFMYTAPYRLQPVELEITPPPGWHVTTGMDMVRENRFTAPDYDTFVDCPLEIGTQKDIAFEVDGVPHVLSMSGQGDWDQDSLVRDVSTLVRAHRDFWGGLPYARYVFLVHCVPHGGGGTEHLNSTILGTNPFVFKEPESYRSFLGLVSHEFFHTWNVKQLRPAALVQPDFQRENYTEELWVAEGTTSYYGGLLMLRAGLSTREKYLESVANEVFDDMVRPGNTVESASSSSFDAWVKYWHGTRQAYNMESDYYARGAAVSLVLDLEVRHRTQNKKSLDDVMRLLYRRFPRGGRGYTNADVQALVEECAGGGMKEFFDSYVHGTAPLPWKRTLGYAGLELIPGDRVPSVWTGWQAYDAGNRVRITRVVTASPAEKAGLDIDDEIVALDGYRVASTATLQQRIAQLVPGSAVRIAFFRRDRLRECTIVLEKPPHSPMKIGSVAAPDAAQKALLDSWLR